MAVQRILFIYYFVYIRDLHSFPTRRSSDLRAVARRPARADQRMVRGREDRRHQAVPGLPAQIRGRFHLGDADQPLRADRKSTRLNSSHSQISYAVFCLKKKTMPREKQATMR